MAARPQRLAFWNERLAEMAGRWERLPRQTESWRADPEILHQWRTTYRRLQCLWCWGPRRQRVAFREAMERAGLRDLMKRSSAIRDHHVAVLHLRAWASEAPFALDPLIELLLATAARDLDAWIPDWFTVWARAPLAEWWGAFPMPPSPDPPLTPPGEPSPAGPLRRRIRRDFTHRWTAWERKLRELAATPLPAWDAAALHRLRIDAKQLRYLGEWWQPHLSGRQQRLLHRLDAYHQIAGRLQDASAIQALMLTVRATSAEPREREAACWVAGRAAGDLSEQRLHLAWSIDHLLWPAHPLPRPLREAIQSGQATGA